MDHDQLFKNLILDYPRESLAFFAPAIAAHLPPDARLTPLRQEQLQERFGDRFRELDTPLLVEFPSGEREAIVFDLEEHTAPATFEIHRLARYCLDLAEFHATDRVVPVVIFLRAGAVAEELRLGVEEGTFLTFRYLSTMLPRLEAAAFATSGNLVARLNLPNMQFPQAAKLDVYTRALEGLLALEPDPNRRRKYLDFIDAYARLSAEERREWLSSRPEREAVVSWWTEEENKARAEGERKGRAEGERKGRAEGQALAAVRFAESGRITAAVAIAEIEELVRSGELTPELAAPYFERLRTRH